MNCETLTTPPTFTRTHHTHNQKTRKKESILDLKKHLDKKVRVKFQGGREVTGILKGFDQLVNLVLDEAVEHMQQNSRLNAKAGCERKT